MSESGTSPFWDSLQILEGQHWVSQGFRGRGDLEFSGNLKMSGEWTGTIRSKIPETQLHVMKGAQVAGSIQVPRLSVEGELNDVEVEVDWLRVMAGGRISGKIRSKVIIVEEGAQIQGRLMTQSKDKL